MDADLQAKYRGALEERRQRLLAVRDRLVETGLGTTQGDSLGELSTYDNHPADIGSETFERSKDLARRLEYDARLREVELALDRLRSGDYGHCLRCGREIGAERLEAIPEASLCRECKQALEDEEAVAQRVRPVEEEVLSPPFGRTFRDGDGNVAYDGEDAWQDVARYGTSETPQDVPDHGGYERLYVDAYERRGAVTDVEAVIDDEGEPLGEVGEEEAPGDRRTGRRR